MKHLTDEELEAPGEAPHLKECAQCQAAVRRAAGRRKLLKGVKPYTLSDVAFSRVDAKLMEHVRENPPGPRFGFGRLLAFAALAAVGLMFAVTTVRPLLSNETKPDAVATASAPAAFEPMTVLHAGPGVSVKAGDVLQRDAVVDAMQGRVVLATADGASLRLAGGARFQLGAHDATATLVSGTLNADATRGGPWVVAAGGHWVKTADALFDVAADELRVYRGTVVLADNAAFTNPRQVSAPSWVRLHDGVVSKIELGANVGIAKTALPAWARLELKLTASEVELDGQSVGGAPFSMLSTPGKHHLRAHIGDAWREADVELTTGSPGVVDLPEKKDALAIAQPNGPVVEADPAAMAAAIKAQLPKLRVCHEKWLKVTEGARGKVLMSITVSPKGKVTKTSFTSDEGVPEAVNECLGRAARAMKLPQSSEEVELELPVVLGGQ